MLKRVARLRYYYMYFHPGRYVLRRSCHDRFLTRLVPCFIDYRPKRLPDDKVKYMLFVTHP